MSNDLTISDIADRWGVSVQAAAAALKRARKAGLLTGRLVEAGPVSCWMFERAEFERWEKIYRRG